MKTLTLIKPVDHHQIGHIYEHIVADSLTRLFRDKGLFAYVDYHMIAKTYYSGYIYLEVALYTPEAQKIEGIVQKTPIAINEDSINAALLQIMAEKCVDIAELDKKIVARKLKAYNDSPWQEAAESTIPADQEDHYLPGMSFEPRGRRHFGILKQTISYKPQNIYLSNNYQTALFVIISKAVRLNLQEDITRNSFVFSYDDKFIGARHMLKDINLYKIDKRQANKLTSEIDTTRDLLKDINRNGFVHRLSKFLTNLATEDADAQLNESEILRKVGKKVSNEEWRQIATDENIQKILESCEIKFELGRSKASLRLSDIL